MVYGDSSSEEELVEQVQSHSPWKDSNGVVIPKLQLDYKRVDAVSDSDDDGEEEEKIVYLSEQFDEDADYIQDFDVLGWHTKERMPLVGVSASVLEEMVHNSEETLRSLDLTPRDITQNLERLSTAIRMTSDPVKKARYIKSYEVFKFDHDEDNTNDKEKARYALEDARNRLNKPFTRLNNYKVAIKFTNNIKEKENLRAEYKQYCLSLKK